MNAVSQLDEALGRTHGGSLGGATLAAGPLGGAPINKICDWPVEPGLLRS